MSAFSSAIAIASDFNTLAEAFDNGSNLYDAITGSNGMSAVVNALSALTSAIEAGLAEVVNAVNNSTYQSDWQGFVTQLNAIQEAYIPLSQQLAAAQQNGNNWTLVQNGIQMSLIQWCEYGTGNELDQGALTVLATQLTNLSTLFAVGGSVGDPSMLNLWANVCTAALQANMAGFSGQNQYTLTLGFLQQIFGIVGTIVYTHEAALQAYLVAQPANPNNFASIRPFVTQNFGDYTMPSTVWGDFNTVMNGMLAPAAPFDQNGTCATTCDSGAGAGDTNNCAELTQADDWNSSVGERILLTQLVAPAGSYFGQFQIQQETFPYVEDSSIMYMQAMPVAVGANMTFTPGAWTNNAAVTQENYMNMGTGTSGSGGSLYVTVAYAPPPAQTAQDCFSVVTGVQFVEFNGNSMAFAVQFSTLDLSVPASPSITNPQWVQPVGGDYFATYGWDNWSVDIDWIDCRPTGTPDAFPVSNIAMVQTSPTGNGGGPGNRIGLAVQNGLPFHTLTCLQPDTAYGPSATKTR